MSAPDGIDPARAARIAAVQARQAALLVEVAAAMVYPGINVDLTLTAIGRWALGIGLGYPRIDNRARLLKIAAFALCGVLTLDRSEASR